MMKKLLFFCFLTLSLCGCEGDLPSSNDNPVKPTPPVGLDQKIETLNENLVALKSLTEAAARSIVRSVVEQAGLTQVLFQDGTEVVLVCDPEATGAPLLSLRESEGENYWVLTLATQTPWLKDALGERMPLSGALPVLGLDDNACWTVKTAEQPTPWSVVDAAGEPVVATGKEPVAMFRSVAVSEGRMEVVMADGGALKAEAMTNLSAAGTANCYVVSAPGRYLFNASVRGNGVGEKLQVGAEAPIQLGEGVTADWLWTDVEGLVSEVAYDPTTREIGFTLAQAEGNVLLALMQEGVVIWSWHIWATDAPQSMVFGNGVTLMDRNLGAVSAEAGSTDAYGLYYQWGRKDPFYGGKKAETSAEAFLQAKAGTIFNPLYAGLTWSASATATTPAEAAAHPTTFYNAKVGLSYDWLSKPLAGLWAETKSLNDPCPVGYKVPASIAWDSLHSSHSYIDDISVWDGTAFGMRYTFGEHSAWFVAQGYRNYSSGSIVGLRTSMGGSGAYWSSETSASKAYYLYFRSKLSSAGSINPDGDKERSYGYSVRCCKE